MNEALEWVEAVFMLAAVLGGVFSALDWWDARKDHAAVKATDGRARPTLMLVARRDVRSSGVSTVGFGLLLVGVTMRHFLEAVSVPWWLLSVATSLFAANAVMDSRVRSEVLLLAEKACDDGENQEGNRDGQPGAS